MRSRELWLWLGGACLTLGTVLAATALAYFTKEKHYSLITSPLMIAAVVIFLLAFAVFLGAIFDWPFPSRKLKFPDIRVEVADSLGETVVIKPIPGIVALGVTQPPRTEWFIAWDVRITNREQERTVSIKVARLRIRSKSGIGGGMDEVTYTCPPLLDFDSSAIRKLDFPLNIPPQETGGGHFVFNVLLPTDLLDMSKSWIEIEETHTGKWARFPTQYDKYSIDHGLQVLDSDKLNIEHYPS